MQYERVSFIKDNLEGFVVLRGVSNADMLAGGNKVDGFLARMMATRGTSCATS